MTTGNWAIYPSTYLSLQDLLEPELVSTTCSHDDGMLSNTANTTSYWIKQQAGYDGYLGSPQSRIGPHGKPEVVSQKEKSCQGSVPWNSEGVWCVTSVFCPRLHRAALHTFPSNTIRWISGAIQPKWQSSLALSTICRVAPGQKVFRTDSFSGYLVWEICQNEVYVASKI